MSKLGDYLMESFLVAIVVLVILGLFSLIYLVSFWIGLVCTIILWCFAIEKVSPIGNTPQTCQSNGYEGRLVDIDAGRSGSRDGGDALPRNPARSGALEV